MSPPPLFASVDAPLTYGITPPKTSTDAAKRREIARVQSRRISTLPIDGLVVYDLQDESTRTDAIRPFPFMSCIDPADYAFDDLASVTVPKIVYRGVSNHTARSLQAWLTRVHTHAGATVLVGAPSRRQTTSLSLSQAYEIRRDHIPELACGGVMIAERHQRSVDEHERVLAKVDRGCQFLISQAVYAVTATKDVLSDLVYRCRDDGRDVPLVLVTLSPCGSQRTLEFLHWLGISIPRWLENELRHARDILQTSVDMCLATFAELDAFARDKGFRLGCNVESVSLRKDEIDASVHMVHAVRALLDRGAAPTVD